MQRDLLVIKIGFYQYRWALIHNNEVTYLDKSEYPSQADACDNALMVLSAHAKDVVISNISYCGLEEVLNEFVKKDKETA